MSRREAAALWRGVAGGGVGGGDAGGGRLLRTGCISGSDGPTPPPALPL